MGKRNFSLVHRLRVKLQRNGRGPKHRFYWAPRMHVADVSDWEALLTKPGPEGGMAAVPCPDGLLEDFLKDLEELDEAPLPDDQNIFEQADRDFRHMVRALARAGKRKVFPEWGFRPRPC